MYSAISLKYYETFRSSSISAAEMARAISVFLVEALAETKKTETAWAISEFIGWGFSRNQ